MSVGGTSSAASLAELYVSERDLARGANIARARWDAAASSFEHYWLPDGKSLVTAREGHKLAASLMSRGDAGADRVMARMMDKEGAVWRRTNGGFVPLSPVAAAQDAASGAAGVRAPLNAAASTGSTSVSEFVRSKLAGRNGSMAAVIGAGLIAGLALRTFVTGGGESPTKVEGANKTLAPRTDQPVDVPGAAAKRARAAELASQQAGVVDTTSDKQLDPRVQRYIESSTGTAPSRSVDWTGDMVGWIWAQAGTPLGRDGVGGHDVAAMVRWSRDLDIWADGTPSFDPKQPDRELGQVLVLQGNHKRMLDLGVVIRADANEIELVMGNRGPLDTHKTGTKDSRVDGEEIGKVHRLIVDRNNPIVAGLIDPARLDPARADEPAPKAPDKPAPTEAPQAPGPPKAPVVSPEALREVAPWLSVEESTVLGASLGAAFTKYNINTPARAAAAVAQFAHESDRFRTTEEYASGARYEGRVKDLGNTQPGDGKRFKGRGYIQITGRHNYTLVSEAFKKDFLAHPELLATPEYAAMASAWWWNNRNLNEVADSGDFRKLTKIINGGYSHLAEREAFHASAKKVAHDLVPK